MKFRWVHLDGARGEWQDLKIGSSYTFLSRSVCGIEVKE